MGGPPRSGGAPVHLHTLHIPKATTAVNMHLQQKPENSALCEHVILFDHVIDWANSRILKTESNFSKRLTAESWFILSRPKVINRSDGESFPIFIVLCFNVLML